MCKHTHTRTHRSPIHDPFHTIFTSPSIFTLPSFPPSASAMCSTKEVSPEEESSDVTATPEGTEQTLPAMNGNAEDLSMQAYTNIHAEAIPQADAKRQFSAGSHDAREFACEVSCTMKTCVREKPSATAVDVGGDGMDAGGNGAPKKKR